MAEPSTPARVTVGLSSCGIAAGAGKVYEAFEYYGLKVLVEGNNPMDDPNIARTMWEEMIGYAEAHNQPGTNDDRGILASRLRTPAVA